MKGVYCLHFRLDRAIRSPLVGNLVFSRRRAAPLRCSLGTRASLAALPHWSKVRRPSSHRSVSSPFTVAAAAEKETRSRRRNRVSRAKSYPPCAPGTEQPTQQSRLKEEEAEETPRRRKSQHRKHRDGPTDPSVLVCRCSSWNKEHEKSVQRCCVQCCAYQMD